MGIYIYIYISPAIIALGVAESELFPKIAILPDLMFREICMNNWMWKIHNLDHFPWAPSWSLTSTEI